MAEGQVEKEVKQLLNNHETKYTHVPASEGKAAGWRWSCNCGQDQMFKTRDECTDQTKTHWASLIDQMVADCLQSLKPEPAGESQDEVPQIPSDLSVMSFLLREVDCERMTMPQARKALGDWWNRVPDKPKITDPGRTRMRRLKQIADGMYEEFWTLLGTQGNA